MRRSPVLAARSTRPSAAELGAGHHAHAARPPPTIGPWSRRRSKTPRLVDGRRVSPLAAAPGQRQRPPEWSGAWPAPSTTSSRSGPLDRLAGTAPISRCGPPQPAQAGNGERCAAWTCEPLGQMAVDVSHFEQARAVRRLRVRTGRPGHWWASARAARAGTVRPPSTGWKRPSYFHREATAAVARLALEWLGVVRGTRVGSRRR